jgi:hypothetical protein
MSLRRAYWWASWQAWLFAHPPQDPDPSATRRWVQGRLGCFLVALALHWAFWVSVAIVVLWVRWAFDL